MERYYTSYFYQVAKKKSKSKSTPPIRSGTKNIFIASIFILFWAISLFTELDSTLGYYTFQGLQFLFWDLYKWIFTPIIIILGGFLYFKPGYVFNNGRFFWLLFYFFSLTTLIGWLGESSYHAFFNFHTSLSWFFGANALLLSMFLLFLLSLYLMFHINYKTLLKKVISITPDLETVKQTISLPKGEKVSTNVSEKNGSLKKKPHIESPKAKQLNFSDAPKKIAIEEKTKDILTQVKEVFWQKSVSKMIPIQEKKPSSIPQYKTQSYDGWELPDIELLSDIWWDVEIDERDIQNKQAEIIDKLAQFKIDVTMTGYRAGPTVTQFRLQPDDGIKLNKIENLKKDLTLALHAKSLRIQAPIPGEWVVGIEVPNDVRQAVGLKEIITSKVFQNPKHEIPLAIGKDVNGDVIVWDLTKMPHLLVAGQTASGKSVGMNGFIISMLYRFSPSELKMILIDPKMVELSLYNGIPHLLTPVITNPDKALNSLKWAVAEMLRRYDLAKSLWARNLKEYNAKANKDEKLPYIVIIVDELADLMMSGNKKEVEGAIARIAQMARAVGMHLIVATQRPSVDVITGLIKANIPSRIAFTVASQIDSRTVIDRAWAEDLLGKWDMLYAPTGVLEPSRVQGVLVETDEVEEIVTHIKMTIDPNMIQNLYDDSIVSGKSNTEGSVLEHYNGDQEEDPELVEKAIQVVREAKKWSTSLVQRKLGLWYARAAKILDILEELWVVGPANGSKPRDVYE